MPTARAPALVQRGDQLPIDASSHYFNYRIEHRRSGDAQAIHELALDAALGQVARHLLAATVDHHRRVVPRNCRDLPGESLAGCIGIQQRTAQFYQQLHSSPSASGYPSIRFMFCTACPAAPLTRLSIALTTTARPVVESTTTPISQ